MRGQENPEASMFSYVTLEQRVPKDHRCAPCLRSALMGSDPINNKHFEGCALTARFMPHDAMRRSTCPTRQKADSGKDGGIVNYPSHNEVTHECKRPYTALLGRVRFKGSVRRVSKRGIERIALK